MKRLLRFNLNSGKNLASTTMEELEHCCHGPLKPVVVGLFGLLIAATIFFMIFAAMNELKQSRYIGQDVEHKNSITIAGQGKVQARPDIGVINLGVVSQAQTVAVAQKDNTEKMNRITKAMKDLGVAEKDLKTASYDINPRYDYSNGRQTIIGYETNQSLEIKIRDLDKAGQIISRAGELGANQVGSLNFTFDDPEASKIQARKNAIGNAKEKAKTLAGELGVKLVRIIDFSETSNGAEPPIFYAKEALGMGGGESSPDVLIGQNEITASVSITYEIQ